MLWLVAACSGGKTAPDAPTSAWSEGPMLPLPRLEPGVTSLGQQVIVLGGFDTGQTAGLDVTTHVDVYDVNDMMWNEHPLPDAPVARHHAQVATIGASLYLLGGLDGMPDAANNYPARGDVYRLDTLSTPLEWQQLTSIPAGFERGSAAVVVVPPRIYLFGGASTTAALASNIYYDVAHDTWTAGDPALPDLPAPRSHPVAMRRSDGAFVVAGGLATLTSDSAVAAVYQLAPGQAWQATMPLPEARGGCAAGVILGQLVCAGGEAGTSALTYTELYDPYNDAWMTSELMPAPTAGTQGTAIGDRLFVPGGSRTVPSFAQSFAPTDTLYIFAPLDTAPR